MEARKKVKTRIFLGYTSNMMSSGVRDSIRYLVQHKLVGGIWETKWMLVTLGSSLVSDNTSDFCSSLRSIALSLRLAVWKRILSK